MYYAQKYILVFLLFASQLFFNILLTTDVFEYPKFLALIFITGALTALNVFDAITNGHVGTFFRGGQDEGQDGSKTRRIIFFFLLLFFVSNGLALLFSQNPTVSFVGADTRFQGFLSHIYYIFLFLNTFYFFRRYPTSKTSSLFFWLLVLLFVVDALAVLPFLFPMTFPFYFFTPAFFYGRIYGTFGNPNYLASFIITLLPFLVFRFRAFQGKWAMLALWVFFSFTLVVLFLTGSRSAWLASILGFLFLGIFEVITQKKYKILGLTLGITFLLVLGVFARQYTASPVLERLSFDTAKSTSLQTRFNLWKAGFEMFLKKPFTGYGQEMIKENIEQYLPSHLKKNQVFFIDRTHSEFIDILVTGGIFAFIGYAGFLLVIFLQSILKSMLKSIQGGVSPALVAFLTLALFQAVNFSTISSNVFLYFLAAYLTSSFGAKKIGV